MLIIILSQHVGLNPVYKNVTSCCSISFQTLLPLTLSFQDLHTQWMFLRLPWSIKHKIFSISSGFPV